MSIFSMIPNRSLVAMTPARAKSAVEGVLCVRTGYCAAVHAFADAAVPATWGLSAVMPGSSG